MWHLTGSTVKKTQGHPGMETDNDPGKSITAVNSFECCEKNFVTSASENGTLIVPASFQLNLSLDFFSKC